MRIAHSADFHIDQRRRFAPHIVALTEMILEAVRLEVDAFVFCGDFSGLDAPHSLTPKELLALVDLFQLASSFAPVVAIPGNHDEAYSLNILSKIESKKGIFYCPEPSRIEVAGMDFYTLPWMGKGKILSDVGSSSITDENDLASSRLRDILRGFGEPGDESTLLAHYPVDEAKMGSVEVRTSDDVTLPPRFLESLGFGVVTLGHLHCRQSCGSSTWYSGSPVPIDFGEAQPKGFNLIELPSGKAQFIKQPSWNMKKFGLTLDEAESAEFSEEDLTDCYVRLDINIPYERRLEINPFKKLKDKVEAMGALEVKIKNNPEPHKRVQMPHIVAHRTTEEKLRALMEEKGIAQNRVDPILSTYRQLGTCIER